MYISTIEVKYFSVKIFNMFVIVKFVQFSGGKKKFFIKEFKYDEIVFSVDKVFINTVN